MSMLYEMINTQEAVKLFHHLMKTQNQVCVLRLVGDSKMGKTHLLTKVFPIIARQAYQARCAIIDLRHPAHSVPDFLHFACSQLGGQSYDFYYTAYQEWLNRPKTVGLPMLLAFWSRIKISLKDSSSDLHQRDLHLTTQFVKDLSKLDDKRVLLLFDNVDNAHQSTQTWLMDTLLVQLSSLPHIRIVIAGRSLPEASSTYTACCQNYRLLPVKEVEAYIEYCHSVNLMLSDQSIRDFAHAFGYAPGIFVDYVIPSFAPQFVPQKGVS